MLLCYNCEINDYIYVLSTRPATYLLHGVTVKSHSVWNPFSCYAASSSVVGDGHVVSFVFGLWRYLDVSGYLLTMVF